MKKPPFLYLLLVILFVAGCKRLPETPYEAVSGYPARSPSQKYWLVLTEHYEPYTGYETYKSCEVYRGSATGPVVMYGNVKFRVRDTYRFQWDEQNRVWGYSGDIGTYVWQETKGKWKRYTYEVDAPKGLKPPPGLKD